MPSRSLEISDGKQHQEAGRGHSVRHMFNITLHGYVDIALTQLHDGTQMSHLQ